MQFCQFGSFLDQKSRFRIFFENLKISETFFFVIGKRIKLSAVCEKNHRNRTNGSGDITLQSKKIIEISWLLKKILLRRKIEAGTQKMKKTKLELIKFFIPKPKNASFFSTANFRWVPYFVKLAILQNEVKNFDFPNLHNLCAL